MDVTIEFIIHNKHGTTMWYCSVISADLTFWAIYGPMVTLTSDYLLVIITELGAPKNSILDTKTIKSACLRAEILIVPFFGVHPLKGAPKIYQNLAKKFQPLFFSVNIPHKVAKNVTINFGTKFLRQPFFVCLRNLLNSLNMCLMFPWVWVWTSLFRINNLK